MLRGDDLVGVLSFQAAQVNRFDENALLVGTALAAQVAVAAQNARLYAEQVETAEQLRSMDRIKSEFLANMSHELRTPLNAILNFTEFVSMGVLGSLNVEQSDALSKVTLSAEHLLSLINDVLDMTKIEAGMIELFIENVDLGPVMAHVLETSKALRQDKPIEVLAEVAPNLPVIQADERRVRQIMLNLVSNAMKFTLQGSVTVGAQLHDDHVLLFVRDTGPGISPEEQEIIFKPFRQTKQGAKHVSSTGLGLPISRHLAEAHGGRLWVESEVGHGTTFFATLSLQRPAPVPALVSTEVLA
jgi:signal transduction histidine kinase